MLLEYKAIPSSVLKVICNHRKGDSHKILIRIIYSFLNRSININMDCCYRRHPNKFMCYQEESLWRRHCHLIPGDERNSEERNVLIIQASHVSELPNYLSLKGGKFSHLQNVSIEALIRSFEAMVSLPPDPLFRNPEIQLLNLKTETFQSEFQIEVTSEPSIVHHMPPHFRWVLGWEVIT